jgi:hypothetical protein
MSMTCPMQWRKPNHQVGHTRENATGYAAYAPCTKEQHKTQLPQAQFQARNQGHIRQGGAEASILATKFNDLVSAPLDPTQFLSFTIDDDVTVRTSNVLSRWNEFAHIASHPLVIDIDTSNELAHLASKPPSINFNPSHGFVQRGIHVLNCQIVTRPLMVNLSDGRQSCLASPGH